jgi:hypothetical protein
MNDIMNVMNATMKSCYQKEDNDVKLIKPYVDANIEKVEKESEMKPIEEDNSTIQEISKSTKPWSKSK